MCVCQLVVAAAVYDAHPSSYHQDPKRALLVYMCACSSSVPVRSQFDPKHPIRKQ